MTHANVIDILHKYRHGEIKTADEAADLILAEPQLTSYEAGISAERDRCYAIIERARFGEIDRDWRSILHRITCGMAANEE